MMRSGRSGFSRSRTNSRSIGKRSGQKRKLVWDPNTFSANALSTGSIVELVLITEAQLQEKTLGRGTIGPIYGRIVIYLPETVVQGQASQIAWGIRLKEADAAATGLAFSPFLDGDSSDWITWRSGSIIKSSGAGTGPSGNPVNWIDEHFTIKNPRKIQADQELVMLLENSLGSNATINYTFWCRVGLILP
jgi:hypothetical protein